jgi:hypothetical protein
MKKVFIGLTDISSQISAFKEGFNELGWEVMTASTESQNVMLLNDVDYKIDKYFPAPFKFFPLVRPRKFQLFLQENCNPAKNYVLNKAVRECDLFIFIYNTFKRDFSDLEYIKNKGKKIIFILTGGHEIWYYAAKQYFEKFQIRPLGINPNYYSRKEDLERALLSVRNAEKYSDLIYSLPYQSQIQLRPYNKFWIPIKRSFITGNISCQRQVPKIVHLPSSPMFKGTKYVLSTIDSLKNKGINFDFELVHSVPHLEALKIMSNCDIVINQLLAPSPGKLGYEGLALGKVVVSFLGRRTGFDDGMSKHCPIVDANPDNLEEIIMKLIQNQKLRQRIADKGPRFISKYHLSSVCVERILKDLYLTSSPEFIPTFFRNEFIPESNEVKPIYNKWTEYVKKESWYNKYIKKGFRDDLEF